MEYVVIIDKRGRIVLPSAVRKRLNLKEEAKMLVKLREDGVVELAPLDKIKKNLEKTFEAKFREWREEDHEASKLLHKLVKNSGNS